MGLNFPFLVPLVLFSNPLLDGLSFFVPFPLPKVLDTMNSYFPISPCFLSIWNSCVPCAFSPFLLTSPFFVSWVISTSCYSTQCKSCSALFQVLN